MTQNKTLFAVCAAFLLVVTACSTTPPETVQAPAQPAAEVSSSDDRFPATSTPITIEETALGDEDANELINAVESEVEPTGEVAESPTSSSNGLEAAGVEETYNSLPVGFTTDGNAYIGNIDAPVVIEEYSDYQCPFCARFAATTMAEMKANGAIANGEAVLVFYDFPLDFHPQAPAAANAARCAGETGPAAYWAMHDALFEDVRGWSTNDPTDVFIELGNSLGIELDADFPNCLAELRYEDAIYNDFNIGRSKGIGSTPSFLLNGNPLIGAQPIAAFDRAISALVAGEEIPSNEPQVQAADEVEIPPFEMPEPVVLSDEAAGELGDPDAPILIVEFTDYQCPFCSRHSAETMPIIMQELIDTGRVRYQLKDFPLDQLHPDARQGATAARCAGEQDAYWEMHDTLFNNQAAWGQGGLTPDAIAEAFVGFAGTLNLDTDAFSTCLSDGRYDDVIEANFQEGAAEQVQGTPAFFIGGYFISGAQPYEVFDLVVTNLENGTLEDIFRESYEAQVAEYRQQLAAQQQQQQQPQLPTEPVDINTDGDLFIGDENAPVTIIEFTDYGCPFCGRHFENTYPFLKSNYVDTGFVKYVFKDYPLSFHPEADEASEAARCANDQGGFVEMHASLFTNQAEWNGNPEFMSLFVDYAVEIGLDEAVFADCLNSGKYRDLVQEQIKQGQALGVTGTPTFFINGNAFVGAQPFQSFARAIDSFLNAEN